MGKAVKAVAGAATILVAGTAVLTTWLVIIGVALGLFVAPTLIVGAIVSVLFGIGFWVASGYVFLARLAIRLLFGH